MLKQGFNPAPNIKMMFNIGALMDIPTGTYMKGQHGENILLGGLGSLTGVVGTGNSFKSTLLHYMMLSAMDRIMSSVETSASTYDTEINMHEHRLAHFADQFEHLAGKDIIQNGTWVITDKTVYYANEWYERLKDFLKSKKDHGKKYEHETPFLDRDNKTTIKYMVPTFSEVDSFSEFETADVAKMQAENELGDSGANTIHMRQGLAKTRFFMDVPTMIGIHHHFLLITAQMGKDLQVAAGPYAAPPAKKLQHMKQGDKIKGVTDKFFFFMSNCWHVIKAAPLTNQNTKGPEYPANPDDNMPGDTDLNIVSMIQLRSKSGLTGYTIDLLVSQRDGVLPSLSEFHYIKSADRFGISGTLHSYSLDLMPDVKLGRTTVRSKLDADPKLRRAMNITAELAQIHQFYRYDQEELCTAKEIYEFFTKEGYDMDMILGQTRGWWTFDNDKQPLMFLSTKDIIEVVKKGAKIYWLEDDKKTIKPEFAKYMK